MNLGNLSPIADLNPVLIGEWENQNRHIAVYRSNSNSLSALIKEPKGDSTTIQSSQILCGIRGMTDHQIFIQKIDQVAHNKIRDEIAVFPFPSTGKVEQLWIFEAPKSIAPLIKKGKELQKQCQQHESTDRVLAFQETLSTFETALKIQENKGYNNAELKEAILKLREEFFLFQAKNFSHLFLPPGEPLTAFTKIIELYEETDGLFDCLRDYLQVDGNFRLDSPREYLAALLNEHYLNDPITAALHYLNLSKSLFKAGSNPTPCLKKTYSLLIQTASDPFVYPHFLEKLDRDLLVESSQKYNDPELQKWLLHKDATRIAFEDLLLELSKRSSQKAAPKCFICFNVEEKDVGEWLEHVLVPDLDKVGIKPLFCLRDLTPGEDLNNFQALIRKADQVIVICTPNLKIKCLDRIKAPIGVAQEIRLAQERYNDPSLYNTIFPLYLKGNRESSCPSVFFEPIFGTSMTYLDRSRESSVFTYYASAFELFGQMRGILREISREIKEAFLEKTKRIEQNEVNLDEIEKWRDERTSRHELLLDRIHEDISKNIQMDNLPCHPRDFTGRKAEQEDIRRALSDHLRVAIAGLGGLGKTALALKYGNDSKSNYQFIQFIPAGTVQLMIDGLVKLADDLILLPKAKDEEKLKKLMDFLENKCEQDYLLILDGVDQLEILQQIKNYLPEKARLLMTTRLPEQARDKGFHVIDLQPLIIEDAKNYLLNTTNSKEADNAEVLANRLGCLPLALTHAVGYIRSRKFTLNQYITSFNQYKLDLFKNEYLNLKAEEKTILTTWTISINEIEKNLKCQLGQEVLEFFSLLGQAPIPLDLIINWFNKVYPNRPQPDLENALGKLCDFSMIDGMSASYRVHRLVQEVTQFQMSAQRKQRVFEKDFDVLNFELQLFQEDNVINLQQTRSFIPHAMALVSQQELLGRIDVLQQCIFMSQLGLVDFYLGHFDQALECHEKALGISRKILETDLYTARSLNNIAYCYHALGNKEMAMQIQQEAKRIKQNYLAVTDVNYNTLRLPERAEINRYDLNEMPIFTIQDASKYLLLATGLHEEDYAKELAEKLERFPLALSYAAGYIRMQKITIARYIQELFLYELEGCDEKIQNLTKVERTISITCRMSIDAIEKREHCPLAHEVLEFLSLLGQAPIPLILIEEWLSQAHPNNSKEELKDTLRSLSNYSLIRARESESYSVDLFIQNVTRNLMSIEREHVLFEKNIDILNAHMKLFNKDDLSTLKEVIPFIPHAMALFYKQDLISHIDILKQYHFMNLLGQIGCYMGQYSQALKCHEGALEISKKIFIENHLLLAKNMDNVGSCHYELGHYPEALNMQKEALNIRKAELGEMNSFVAESYEHIGRTFGGLEDFQNSLKNHQEALKIRQQLFGEIDHNTARSYLFVGHTFSQLDDDQMAFEMEEKADKIWEKLPVKKDQSLQMSIYRSIGVSFINKGLYEKALKNLQKSLEISKEIFQEIDHPEIARNNNNVGVCLGLLGRHEEALTYKKQALESRRKLLGEHSTVFALSCDSVGTTLRELGNFEDALNYHQIAYDIRKEQLGVNSPSFADSCDHVGTTLVELGKYEEALTLQNKALEIRRSLSYHEPVATSYENIGSTLEKQGKYQDAFDYKKKGLDIRREVLKGQEDPLLASSYDSLGTSWRSLGKYEEALVYQQKALELRKKLLCENHPDISKSYRNIGLTQEKLGHYLEALESMKCAFQIACKAFQGIHPCHRSTLMNIMELLKNKLEQTAVKKYSNDILEICVQKFGENHELTKEFRATLSKN